MKQRPSIVVFAGIAASALEAAYTAQLDIRGELVSCVSLQGDESLSEILQRMEVAFEGFTAEHLESLVSRRLLGGIDLWVVPVLLVIQSDQIPNVNGIAASIIEAASKYPNLGSKLRFTTVAISEADLPLAREVGRSLNSALDGLSTRDGISFRNSVLLVCKEFRGAPLTEKSLMPVVIRLVLLLTTFDYDSETSAFSVFWNERIGGGGQIFFVGLMAYRVERISTEANSLLFSEAAARLAEILRQNPFSILENLTMDVLASAVRAAVHDLDTGEGLVRGSQQWNRLVELYRTQVMPLLLRELLPKVKSVDDLTVLFESVRDQVRPKPVEMSISASSLASGAVVLIDLNMAKLEISIAVGAAMLAFASFGIWKYRKSRGSSEVIPEKLYQGPKAWNGRMNANPVLCEVLEEAISELKAVQAATESTIPGSKTDAQPVSRNEMTAEDSDRLPFCENVYNCRESESAVRRAHEAVADALLLILLTRLKSGKWLSGELAARLREQRANALRQIVSAMLEDFITYVEHAHAHFRDSRSVQESLFAPTLPISEVREFCFLSKEIMRPGLLAEQCALQNSVDFLYLVD